MEIDEREDMVFVITWLRRHPEELALMRTCARMECAPASIWPHPDDHTAKVRKFEVERYFQSGVFGWCSVCILPCVTFADGVRIEWPSKERHHCREAQPRYKVVEI
jgi:hypothetical protein